MPVEIRELVINASLTETAKDSTETVVLMKEDKQALEEKIKKLEKKIRTQHLSLERKIRRECLDEVKELLAERERNFR